MIEDGENDLDDDVVICFKVVTALEDGNCDPRDGDASMEDKSDAFEDAASLVVDKSREIEDLLDVGMELKEDLEVGDDFVKRDVESEVNGGVEDGRSR